MLYIFISLIISINVHAFNLDKEVLEKSQHLILQKDRLKATSLIVNVIKNKKLSSQQNKNAHEALNLYSRIFLEEGTQLTYEHGMSLVNNDLDKAIQKIQEAQQKEPLNLSVGISIAKIMLLKKQCKEALSGMESYLKAYPFDEELFLLAETATICLFNKSSLLEFLNSKVQNFKNIQIEDKIRFLKNEKPDFNKITQLRWLAFYLEIEKENLSQQEFELLLKKYTKLCPKELKISEDMVEPWLFCAGQLEYQNYFAKKFKVKENDQNQPSM